MYYKQIIVVNKELNMSQGKLAAQVSHASMAFLTQLIKQNAKQSSNTRYPCYKYDWNSDFTEKEKQNQHYLRQDLNTWAEEARNRGEDYFYARPVDPTNRYGELELCEPTYHYETSFTMDKDLYEQWMSGLFTKVILGAKNENQMKQIIEKAQEVGMKEGVDFFCIRDACLTELTPDETGTRWTCIGFRPMDENDINPITKKLQLLKK